MQPTLCRRFQNMIEDVIINEGFSAQQADSAAHTSARCP
jgi:hypothetical protein